MELTARTPPAGHGPRSRSASRRRRAAARPRSLRRRSRSAALGGRPAREQAVAEGAAERVTRAEAADHVDVQPGHDSRSSARRDEHALAAVLDDGELGSPARGARRPRARGPPSPTAISHSSRLPTRRDASRGLRRSPPRLVLVSQNDGAVVEVEDRRRRSRSPHQRQRRAARRLDRERRRADPEDRTASRTRRGRSRSSSICMSGARGSR